MKFCNLLICIVFFLYLPAHSQEISTPLTPISIAPSPSPNWDFAFNSTNNGTLSPIQYQVPFYNNGNIALPLLTSFTDFGLGQVELYIINSNSKSKSTNKNKNHNIISINSNSNDRYSQQEQLHQNQNQEQISINIIKIPTFSSTAPVVFHDSKSDLILMVTSTESVPLGTIWAIEQNGNIRYSVDIEATTMPVQFSPFYITYHYSDDYSDLVATSVEDGTTILWKTRINLSYLNVSNIIAVQYNSVEMNNMTYLVIGNLSNIAYLYCINSLNGNIEWNVMFTSPQISAIVARIGSFIGLIEEGSMSLYDPLSGKRYWKEPMTCYNPITSKNEEILYCNDYNYLYAYYLSNITNIWKQRITAVKAEWSLVYTVLSDDQSMIYVSSSTLTNGTLLTLDSLSGKIINQYDFPNAFSMYQNPTNMNELVLLHYESLYEGDNGYFVAGIEAIQA